MKRNYQVGDLVMLRHGCWQKGCEFCPAHVGHVGEVMEISDMWRKRDIRVLFDPDDPVTHWFTHGLLYLIDPAPYPVVRLGFNVVSQK